MDGIVLVRWLPIKLRVRQDLTLLRHRYLRIDTTNSSQNSNGIAKTFISLASHKLLQWPQADIIFGRDSVEPQLRLAPLDDRVGSVLSRKLIR